MMIWFAGISLDTCCNNTNANKTTTKKALCCECGVFYTITHVDYRVISYKY